MNTKYNHRFTEIVETTTDAKTVYDVYLHPLCGIYPHTDTSTKFVRAFDTRENAMDFIKNASYHLVNTEFDEDQWWKVNDILEHINDPECHCDEWIDYDENDWEEALWDEGVWQITDMK